MGVSVYTGMGVKVDVNVGMIGVNVKVNVGMTGVNVNVGDAVGVAEGSAVNVAVGVLDGLAFNVNSKWSRGAWAGLVSKAIATRLPLPVNMKTMEFPLAQPA